MPKFNRDSSGPRIRLKEFGEKPVHCVSTLCEELQKLHEEPQTSDLGYSVVTMMFSELGLLYVLGLTCTNSLL